MSTCILQKIAFQCSNSKPYYEIVRNQFDCNIARPSHSSAQYIAPSQKFKKVFHVIHYSNNHYSSLLNLKLKTKSKINEQTLQTEYAFLIMCISNNVTSRFYLHLHIQRVYIGCPKSNLTTCFKNSFLRKALIPTKF